MPRKITPEEYKDIFKEKYPNYELLSDYNGDKNYIKVRCKIDGNEWNTKPNWLKQGAGCQICYNNRRGEKTKKTNEEFIKEAIELHGNKYDYSKVEYVNNHTKVCIICPEHGEFMQKPCKHLLKQGCPICGDKQNGINKRITLNDFITRCNEIHENKYDYSNVIYEGWDKQIIIICPEHGEFIQNAGAHLSGHGCPMCHQSKLESKIRKLLLTNNINFEPQYRSKWLGRQSLDFFLPDYNIAIECQGTQHYNKETIRWNQYDFNTIIERDLKKSKKCIKNNIKIIYFCPDKTALASNLFYTKENTVINETDLLKMINFI